MPAVWRNCASSGARRADTFSVKSSGIGTRPGTGFRAVPISENASAQQAATLAVFKSPGFRPVCRKTKLDLVILWEYYLR